MIIGITGNKGHGKDTVASFLADIGYRHVSFANPIKIVCQVIFDWDDDWTNGPYKERVDERWGLSPRQAMQLLGTEYGQFALCTIPSFKEKTGRCLWVNRLLSVCRGGKIAISDVRFKHEAERIREEGGKIVKVIRPSVPVDMSHASEAEVLEIEPDYTIVNDCSLDVLRERVLALNLLA